jgi:hypothetical protein
MSGANTVKVPLGTRPVEFLRGRGCVVRLSDQLNDAEIAATATHVLVVPGHPASVVWLGTWDTAARSFVDCVGALPDKRPARAPDRPKGKQVKLTLSAEQLASEQWRTLCQHLADSSGKSKTINGEVFRPGKGKATRCQADIAVLVTQYGGVDSQHHGQWLLDQVLRLALGPEYQRWREAYDADGDYEDWSDGTPP